MFKFSKASMKTLKQVDGRLVETLQLALSRSPIDFGIPLTGGYRTAEEQHVLFLQGASKADGYEKKSAHQSGMAADVFAFVEGKPSWAPEHLRTIAEVVLECSKELGYNIEWGGNWKKFKDMPHFQIRD